MTEPLKHNEAMELLREIYIPAVEPESYGWVFLFVFGAALLCPALWRLALRRKYPWLTNAKSSLSEIKQLRVEDRALATARWLRQVVMSLETPGDIKALSEDQWLAQLDLTFKTNFFASEKGRAFGTDLYSKKDVEISDSTLTTLEQLFHRRVRFPW